MKVVVPGSSNHLRLAYQKEEVEIIKTCKFKKGALLAWCWRLQSLDERPHGAGIQVWGGCIIYELPASSSVHKADSEKVGEKCTLKATGTD